MENKNKKGFTLVEVIVVIAVFLFIIGTAVMLFLSIVQHQRRLLSQQELLNQTSYVLEYMSKAMRMAKKDDSGNCLSAGNIYELTHLNEATGKYGGIKFVNQSDVDSQGYEACQEFYLDTDGILKEDKTYPPNSIIPPSFQVPLSSEKVTINSINFVINGNKNTIAANEDDSLQPRVTISMQMQILNGNQQSDLKIQTTVSQRNLNIK